MNFSLSALSARIYPIVDFEVVGTLIIKWFCFEEALKFAFIDLKKKKKKKKKAKEGQTSRVSDAVYAHQIDMAAGSVL